MVQDPTTYSKAKDKEARIVSAILEQIGRCDASADAIKKQWRSNYSMFVHGSVFKEKAPWMVDFSTMDLPHTIRTVQGELVNILIQNPRWWDLQPRSEHNPQAEVLRRPLKKLMDYYMKDAKFTRHAGTFILNSLISMGSLAIGWKFKTIINPEYTLWVAKEQLKKEQARLSTKVANPATEDENLTPDGIEAAIEKALSDLPEIAAGGNPTPDPAPQQYIQVGALDLQNPNHELIWWDEAATYMEESNWKAFETECPRYELNRLAKLGYLSRKKVRDIPAREVDSGYARRRAEYKGLTGRKPKEDLVQLLVYEGPLIVDDEVVEEAYRCVIANRKVLLKGAPYAYWEPNGKNTSLINAAIREIPGRVTGAGIGDNAIKLQRTLDSNLHIMCDQMRKAMTGIDVVDRNAVVDSGSLDEGLEPGKPFYVRGKVGEAFQHVSLSSGLELGDPPVNGHIKNAIANATGINPLMMGEPNPKGRTPAAETQARLGAGGRTVNLVALDLEQNFLLPALEKIFARVLQFGVAEIGRNPQLRAVFAEDELMELGALNEQQRMDILQNYYSFKVNGFSGIQGDDDKLKRVIDIMTMVNQNPQGPIAQNIDSVAVVKLFAKLQGLEDEDTLLQKNSPISIITAENVTLLSGHMIVPSPNDDDQMHLQFHQGAAMSGNVTQELLDHIEFHVQQGQQKEAAQAAAQAQQGGQPSQMQ